LHLKVLSFVFYKNLLLALSLSLSLSLVRTFAFSFSLVHSITHTLSFRLLNHSFNKSLSLYLIVSLAFSYLLSLSYLSPSFSFFIAHTHTHSIFLSLTFALCLSYPSLWLSISICPRLHFFLTSLPKGKVRLDLNEKSCFAVNNYFRSEIMILCLIDCTIRFLNVLDIQDVGIARFFIVHHKSGIHQYDSGT